MLIIRSFIFITSLALFAFSSTSFADVQCSNFIEEFITKIKSKSNLTDNFLSNKVDTKYITKFAIGSKWKDLTPEQRKNFYNVYSKYILAKYSKHFLQYPIINHSIISSQEDSRRESVCNIKVEMTTQTEGETKTIPLQIVISYKQTPLIQDIIFENLSLIQVHKQEVTSLLRSKKVEEAIEIISKSISQ